MRRIRQLLRAALTGLLLLLTCSAPAWSADAAAETALALDLREEVHQLAVTVSDLRQRLQTRQIPITVYRPPGAGPFPLVIFNHGRASADQRAQPTRLRYETLARYLVTKGFVVMLPTRVGYGATFGDFDPESTGGCAVMQLQAQASAASDQVLATQAYARSLPYVDANRWLVMGQSVGGLASVATVWRNPDGLLGGVNFAGGSGGNPEQRPGRPCQPQAIAEMWGSKASGARVPMLWLYWENDLYWGADQPRRWHQAWIDGGGKAHFYRLPAVGKDGHHGLRIDMDTWVPLLDKFLAELGFDRPGRPALPPVNPALRVDRLDQVPLSESTRQGAYRAFLAKPPPRAFAIGPTGSWGWAAGDWAVGRALGLCQARRGLPCKLYAVDNHVVWTP